MFCGAFRHNRCLIPASGYCEWLKTPTGKQPYYYTARDSAPLTMAGLWDGVEGYGNWHACAQLYHDCYEPQRAHDRMPVLLQPEDFPRWLAGTANTEMLKPAPNGHCRKVTNSLSQGA